MKAVRSAREDIPSSPSPAPTKPPPPSARTLDLLTLQRVAGNAAVLRMMATENQELSGTVSTSATAAVPTGGAQTETGTETGTETATTMTAVARPTDIVPTVQVGSFTVTEEPGRPFDESVRVVGETWPQIGMGIEVGWLERAEGGDALTLDLTLNAAAAWAADAPDLIDVESAGSPAITSSTWAQAAEDLTPVMIERSWALRAARFWSRSLAVRHELFHVRQFREWVVSCARGVALQQLPRRRDLTVDDESTLQAEVLAIANEANDAVLDHWRQMMMLNLTYFSRPAEVAAYLDGKDEYERLAAAIRQRGATFGGSASSGGEGSHGNGGATVPSGGTGTGDDS